MQHRVYLALGSNLGDRRANLAAALAALAPQVRLLKRSALYETAPWGYADQPDFLNQVVAAETALPPVELLAYLKEIEVQVGRQPSFRYGPRAIDLDILFYDELVLETPELVIPHPRLDERLFVLAPLAEIAPELVHPVLGVSIGDLLVRLPEQERAACRRLEPAVLTFGKRTLIMGVLNLTPDSFSGDGLLVEDDPLAAALEQARRFAAEGADILDLGGESTRPGAGQVSAEAELGRVLPVIQAIAAELDVLVSVDTYKAAVAEAALAAGAHILNDVWGFKADPDIAAVAAKFQAPVILMHNRSSWAHAQIKERLGGRYVGIPYENLVEDVKRELLESVAIAHQASIADDKIILDPGIGFGKSVEQNLELLDRLGEIKALGYPVLLGPSRKSFIGYTLDLPPDQRLEGTAAAAAIGIARGADIIRVHDVQFMQRVARMADAIVRRTPV